MTNKKVRCTRCFGRGYQPQPRPNHRPGFYARTCPGCGGVGERPPTARDLAQARRVNTGLRKNPKVGMMHPDLFEPHDTPIIISPEDALARYGSLGLVESDFSYDEFEALPEDTQEIIRENNEANRDLVVDWLKQHVEWEEEYRTTGDGAEGDYDELHQRVERADVDELVDTGDKDALVEKWVEAGYSEAQVLDAITDAVKDVNNWEFDYSTDSYHHGGTISSTPYEDHETQLDIDWTDDSDAEVKAVLKSLSAWDCEQIENLSNYATSASQLERLAEDGRAATPARRNYSSVNISVSPGGAFFGKLDWDTVTKKVEEELTGQEVAPQRGPATDAAVYTFKDGSYVADLRPEQLAAEGRDLGICVGKPEHGYVRKVKNNEIKIYSLRTPAGRSKFCIEAELDYKGEIHRLRQVKGKGNRLPGFDVGGSGRTERFKSGEVENVLTFVQSLGVDPNTVYDLQPALRALQAPEAPMQVQNPASCAHGHCSWCTPQRGNQVRRNPPYNPDATGIATVVRRREDFAQALDKVFPQLIIFINEATSRIVVSTHAKKLFTIAPTWDGRWMLLLPSMKAKPKYFNSKAELLKLARQVVTS